MRPYSWRCCGLAGNGASLASIDTSIGCAVSGIPFDSGFLRFIIDFAEDLTRNTARPLSSRQQRFSGSILSCDARVQSSVAGCRMDLPEVCAPEREQATLRRERRTAGKPSSNLPDRFYRSPQIA
jgi:hypothetical protein